MSVNNYIAAANASKQAFVAINDANNASRPDYARVANEAVNQAALNAVNAAENNAEVANARINAERSVRNTRIKEDRDEALRGYKRQAQMTGKLAGGVALLGIGAMNLGKVDDKEPDSRLSILQNQIAMYQDRIAKSGSEITDLQNQLDNFEIPDMPSKSGGKKSAPETMGVPTGSQSNTGAAQASDAWTKLSSVIRYAEGTLGDKGYNTQFTGSQFSDLSRHPRQIKSGGGYSSDAAGAYQFLSTTWDGAKNALGLTDFSPASQEKAGRYLTQNRGVNPDQLFTTKEEFTSAIDKLSKEWAGLPTAATGTSYYGQGGKSIDDLWNRYQGF